MKYKAVAAHWFFVFSLVLLSHAFVSTEAKAQLPDRNLSLVGLANQLQTPEQIARYMWRHFAYETDQRQFGNQDHWQTPEEFMKNGKGDCEDFARFAYELLKLNGYEAYLLNIYGGHYSHTVCVFKENGKYQAIDGTEVKHAGAEDLKGLSSSIYRFWEKSMIVSPTANNGATILAEFGKRMQASKYMETFA